MALKLSMEPPRIVNLPEILLLTVYKGKCGHLVPTDRVVGVPRDVIPATGPCIWALQESKNEDIFWLLRDGVRYCAKCFCCRCKAMISGSGGNLANHASTHGSHTATWTQEQQKSAIFLFFIKHNIGFSVARDPLMRIFSPGISEVRFLEMLDKTAYSVRDVIRDVLHEKSVTVMIDGWSDVSLRRYLGIGVCFFDATSCKHHYRFLQLNFGITGHSALNQVRVLRECLESFHISPGQVQCLCSDSAAVNTAVAEKLSLTWMPCCLHLWNLIVRNFVLRCPPQFRLILEKINDLRKTTLWVEFLAGQGSARRNVVGFVPTRWGSVCDCVESFCQMSESVVNYQEIRNSAMFSEKDIQLVDGIRNLFARFREVTQMLMSADNREGLATVFEAINAIYMVLRSDAEKEGPFQDAIVQARDEIAGRFFRMESKFCCRLLFTGILNLAHSIPPWLEANLAEVLALMADEVELFTGSTPPASPREVLGERYSDSRSLSDIINGSSGNSESNIEVCDEIHEFMSKRSAFGRMSFTHFWGKCKQFPHLQLLAQQLRSFPTNTQCLERTFSLARRVLSWSRTRLTPQHAGDMCLLSANQDLAEKVLGITIPNNIAGQAGLEDGDIEFLMDEEE